jgi:hypothetical protein
VTPEPIEEEETHELPPAPRPRATVLLDWGEAGPPPPPRPRLPTLVMEPPPRARQATVVMEWPGARAPQPTVAISWGDAAPGEPALDGTMVLTEDDSPLMGTIALSDEQQIRVAAAALAPFAITAAGTPAASRGDIPGAPWAAALAAAAPSPTRAITRSQVLPARTALPDDRVLGAAPPLPAPPPRREIPRPAVRAEMAARIDAW